MWYNTISKYPDSIDPLIFFQDINLEEVEIMKSYNDLVAHGKYNEANKYIRNQEIHGYFASCLNAIENRIYNLQVYLLTKEPKQLFISSDSEPIANNEIIWI